MSYMAGSVNFNGINSQKSLRANPADLVQKKTTDLQTDCTRLSFNNTNCCFYDAPDYSIVCLGTEDLAITQKIARMILFGKFASCRDEIECSVIFINKRQAQCILMTDPLGCYPIYYCIDQHSLFFSNKQQTLTSQCSLNWRLNRRILFELFHLGIISPPDTLISDLYSIPVNHYLEYRNESTLHPFTYALPVPQPYDLSRHTNLLKNNLADAEPMHLMCSGGLDSTVLLAIAAGLLKKKVTLHTVALDKQSIEYQKTQFLQQHFHTENHYFFPEPRQVFEHIEASILAGESEMVGALSSNAAIEYLFARSISQHTSRLITGDDNAITPASLAQQPPGYYHLKYGLLSPEQAKRLFTNHPSSILAFVHKAKPFFSEQDSFHHLRAQRLATHATMIGKIIAKYRVGLDNSQRCIMPLNEAEYRSYIDSLNYYQGTASYHYRDSLQELVLSHKLIPPAFFKQSKSWMPSIWALDASQPFLHAMHQELIADKTLLNDLLDYKILAQLLVKKDSSYDSSLLVTLYYLMQFCKLFKLSY